MEKHNFNLCFKSFNPNGKHMRSHLLNLYVNPKPPQSPSSEDEDHDRYRYELTKKRSAGSEISFTGEVTVTVTANVTTTTETESWRNATVRRRSKRNRKPEKPMSFSPVSSISDLNFSPEEDVARCLMMLSRDQRWKPNESDKNVSEESELMENEIVNVKRAPLARSRYRCDTCNKAFRSYQALGGHRASHKKLKLGRHNIRQQQSRNAATGDNNKLRECPVCFKVFASGQALGGHKRSHVTASSSSAIASQRVNLIDLNLPAPIEDDEVSQMEEVSVVSDGRG